MTTFREGDKVKWYGAGSGRRKIRRRRATLIGTVTQAERYSMLIKTKRGMVLVTPEECEPATGRG